MTLARTPKGGRREVDAEITTDNFDLSDFPGNCGAKVVYGFPDFDNDEGEDYVHIIVRDRYGDIIDEEKRDPTAAEKAVAAKEFTERVRSRLEVAQAIGTTYAKYGKLLAKCGWQVSKPWTNPRTKSRLITVSIGKKGAR